MSVWSIEFKKKKDMDKDDYLENFLNQATSLITGLDLNGDIDRFVQNLDNWEGYNEYYSGGKFVCRGGYMDMDKLREIHSNSNHSIFDAYAGTRESVFKVYADDKDDLYPIIPFVLVPKDFRYIKSNSEMTLDYKLELEGRSRLSGVLKARRERYYSKNKVPVQFSIRRCKK